MTKSKTPIEHKKISISAANARLKALDKEFGKNSEIYQMASEYIERVLDKNFVAKETIKDSSGKDVSVVSHIKNIKEISHMEKYIDEKTGEEKERKVIDKKGTPTKEENLFGRSEVFDEYLPSPQLILKKMKDEYSIEGTIKENKTVLKNYAEMWAKTMNDYDTTVEGLYDILENSETVEGDISVLKENAQKLLDSREKTVSWIEEAKKLYLDYMEQAEDENAKRAKAK